MVGVIVDSTFTIHQYFPRAMNTEMKHDKCKLTKYNITCRNKMNAFLTIDFLMKGFGLEIETHIHFASHF